MSFLLYFLISFLFSDSLSLPLCLSAYLPISISIPPFHPPSHTLSISLRSISLLAFFSATLYPSLLSFLRSLLSLAYPFLNLKSTLILIHACWSPFLLPISPSHSPLFDTPCPQHLCPLLLFHYVATAHCFHFLTPPPLCPGLRYLRG